jgi:ADP-ribose pyrophosphatase YjhB (NUDIX family)
MPNLTVGTIVMKDRATLLITKAAEGPDKGLWVLPDGAVQDGEAVRDASIRSIKEETGLVVEPKLTLFLCERVVKGDHRVGVFVLAEPTAPDTADSLNYFHPGTRYAEAKWVDVRTLGDIQKNEGMSDFTADAFVKFSNFLRAQAAAAPASGTVN